MRESRRYVIQCRCPVTYFRPPLPAPFPGNATTTSTGDGKIIIGQRRQRTPSGREAHLEAQASRSKGPPLRTSCLPIMTQEQTLPGSVNGALVRPADATPALGSRHGRPRHGEQEYLMGLQVRNLTHGERAAPACNSEAQPGQRMARHGLTVTWQGLRGARICPGRPPGMPRHPLTWNTAFRAMTSFAR